MSKKKNKITDPNEYKVIIKKMKDEGKSIYDIASATKQSLVFVSTIYSQV